MARVALELDYHEGQLEVVESEARFKVLSAGRRWGKTRLGMSMCVEAAMKGGRAWWVAPTYPMAMEGWWPLRLTAYDIPGAKVLLGDKEVQFSGGGRVQVRSADDPQALRGAGLDMLVMDEAAFIKPEAWEVLRPAMTDRKGKVLFISTPKGIDNWFHTLWLDADKYDTWEKWQFRTTDNPYIDPTEVEGAREELGSLIYSQEYEAEFVALGGTMFKSDWLRYAKPFVRDGIARYDLLKQGQGEVSSGTEIDHRTMQRFCTVDLAASLKEHADYTVICSVGTHKGKMVVLDIVRRRMEGPDIVPAIRSQMERWDLDVAYIERAGFQLALIQEARRSGLAVKELIPKGDKVARSYPLQARFEAGDVYLTAGAAWLPDLERELLAFPASEHDDQVDALAYAAQVMGKRRQGGLLDSADHDALAQVNPWA